MTYKNIKCVVQFTGTPPKCCTEEAIYFYKNKKNKSYAYCEDCNNTRESLIKTWNFIKINKKEYVRRQRALILK